MKLVYVSAKNNINVLETFVLLTQDLMKKGYYSVLLMIAYNVFVG